MSGVITFFIYEQLGTGQSYVAERRRIPRDEIRVIARNDTRSIQIIALGMPSFSISLGGMTPEQIRQLDEDLLDEVETDARWSYEYHAPSERVAQYLGKVETAWRWTRTESR